MVLVSTSGLALSFFVCLVNFSADSRASSSGLFWEVRPVPSPPPATALQSSGAVVLTLQRTSEWGGLVKTQIASSTPGISGSVVWVGLQDLYVPQVPSWLCCCLHGDYTLRTTAPEKIALSSLLPWPVQSFYFDLGRANNFCVFSRVCNLLEDSLVFRPWRRVIAESWEVSWKRAVADPGLRSLSSNKAEVTGLWKLHPNPSPCWTHRLSGKQKAVNTEVVKKKKKK